MSSPRILEAKERTATGSGVARAVRREKRVPGIVYGDTKDPFMVTICQKSLLTECSRPGFFSRIMTLNVDGKDHVVIARDIQYHTVTDMPLHIDFQRVTKNSRVVVQIPIHFINEDKSPTLKRGGTLNVIVHALDIQCSPDSIPESFTIDLSGIDGNHSITLDSLTLPHNVKAANAQRDHVLATVAISKEKAAAE